MTSEGTQHPGQEPDEAGVGGSAPYGSSQRHHADQSAAVPGPGAPAQQWGPTDDPWGPGPAGRPTPAQRPEGYPAPPPFPPAPGNYAGPGEPGGGRPVDARPGGADEQNRPAPGDMGWRPPPPIPPAEPWTPQQAWRTDPARPAAAPPPAGGFGGLPQRPTDLPSRAPEQGRFEPGPAPAHFEPPAAFEPPHGFEPANPFGAGNTPNHPVPEPHASPEHNPGPVQPPVPEQPRQPAPGEPPSRHGAALPFAPAGPTPLPPQEVRVPGASLAAALGGAPMPPPPADPAPAPAQPPLPQQRGPLDPPPVSDPRPSFVAPTDRPSPPSPPPSPSGGESAAGHPGARGVTASAAVPSGSRVAPPADAAAISANRPPAQPRLYGRPAGPEQSGSGQPQSEALSPNGRAFGPTGSPVPTPEPGSAGQPLPGRSAGQAAQPFGPRPTPPGQPAAPPAAAPPGGPDAAALALPHLSTAAHIQPTSPAEAGRGYRQSGAAPYGDLVDAGQDGVDGPGRHGRPDGYPPMEPSHQPAGYAGGVQAGPAAAHAGSAPPAMHPGSAPPAMHPGSAPPAGAGPATAQWTPGEDREQNRFDAFRPDEPGAGEAKPDQPAPQVRNGRVLVAVLTAAVLLVAVPLLLVWLITRQPGGEAAFNPAVGECVKQSGNTAAPADCAEPNAFTVVAKVERADQCDDPSAPHIEVPGNSGQEQVLCLRSAAAEPAPEEDAAEPGTESTG
ncbi:LppU/SCO3897 family protein [Solwaraspora sp. WMMB335]|uniref:LppU/SCO3897 family protein n=1 Tax=Solwaraspora sp. WMMB335 TaxID=3404118 RepID=UPI003B941025